MIFMNLGEIELKEPLIKFKLDWRFFDKRVKLYHINELKDFSGALKSVSGFFDENYIFLEAYKLLRTQFLAE